MGRFVPKNRIANQWPPQAVDPMRFYEEPAISAWRDDDQEGQLPRQTKGFDTGIRYRLEKVNQIHRLGGPLALLAAGLIVMISGLLTAGYGLGEWLELLPLMDPSLQKILLGVAILVVGFLTAYAAIVMAAATSVELNGDGRPRRR